jgi:hypothetical protein
LELPQNEKWRLAPPEKHKKTNKPGALLVREKGLEPPHLAALEPKSSASTNSATLAGIGKKVFPTLIPPLLITPKAGAAGPKRGILPNPPLYCQPAEKLGAAIPAELPHNPAFRSARPNGHARAAECRSNTTKISQSRLY